MISLTLILTFLPGTLKATKYYLSPTGSDNNSGTLASPFYSLNKAWTFVSAGDTVYMRGGTYSYTTQQVMTGKNGTAGNMIKVWAYPGETPNIRKGYPYTYNNDYGYGVYFSGNYCYWRGIEISHFRQETQEVWYAFRAYGSHNKYELLNIHHSGAGMLLAGSSTDNLVLNCDFHHNVDSISPTPFNNGQGLSVARIDAGTYNTVKGCRFWWNCGDGIDMFYNEGFVEVDSCIAFYNGFIPDTFIHAREELGDGAGFKLGDTQYNHGTEFLRLVKHCVAYHNRSTGIFINAAETRVKAYNNVTFLNGWVGMCLNMDYAHELHNNISYENLYNCSLGSNANLIVDHNTFVSIGIENTNYSVSDADFASVDPSGIDGPRQSNGSLPSLSFMKLAAGSDLIDTGVDVGLPYYGSSPDLGYAEYSTGSTNHPPVISNQSFSLNENSANGSIVGTVVASDPDAGQTLTYSIVS
ncbi:MAG TPA: right-handed parallel beta-helix repeat-containing protein, partial [Bacteroidales bacterium]|nr:right-handed parallel beta-helix repeat-containing protein [Bacteroidales bacterium]